MFNVLAMVAEFEGDLIQMRRREGMRLAKAKGRLRGKQPKLNPRQEAHLVALHRTGEHSVSELGELFGVARSTIYRAIQRDAFAAAHGAGRPNGARGRRLVGGPATGCLASIVASGFLWRRSSPTRRGEAGRARGSGPHKT
jgi:hypothetical protein